jgi:hypothetical protein
MVAPLSEKVMNKTYYIPRFFVNEIYSVFGRLGFINKHYRYSIFYRITPPAFDAGNLFFFDIILNISAARRASKYFEQFCVYHMLLHDNRYHRIGIDSIYCSTYIKLKQLMLFCIHAPEKIIRQLNNLLKTRGHIRQSGAPGLYDHPGRLIF